MQSIDALHYANHDRQIRREMRLRAARNLVKQRRVADLTAAGALLATRPTDDPRQVARAWLGRFLSGEKETLVRDITVAAGVSPAACTHISSIQQKITKAIDNGWLTAQSAIWSSEHFHSTTTRSAVVSSLTPASRTGGTMYCAIPWCSTAGAISFTR
ncbi:hypothetical protein [Streptomyces sp. fd1-xmd]|uniref:hypothetical protein n=1 Tax=Streptomyces sp. fd1-xmd TaxID=1812480 RepID=UPI0013520CA0|nr:hypothetical protein [Streptomyces sp. fd1-xmd]